MCSCSNILKETGASRKGDRLDESPSLLSVAVKGLTKSILGKEELHLV